MKFSLIKTEIEGVKILKFDSFSDDRGKIWSTYIEKEIVNMGYEPFTHDKFSISKKNVIRGIHYDDKTFKLISVILGMFK